MSEGIPQFNGPWRWLSNFWPCQIEFEGITYPSVEHAYQAAKTENHDQRWAISITPKPSDAKRMGRGLKLRDDWDDVKMPIMKRLLEKKFYDQNLRNSLLQTQGELVEGNYWHDNFWGVCSCLRCVNERTTNTGWVGNWLGRLLMEIRQELKVVA